MCTCVQIHITYSSDTEVAGEMWLVIILLYNGNQSNVYQDICYF